jgi:hypothetical protein
MSKSIFLSFFLSFFLSLVATSASAQTWLNTQPFGSGSVTSGRLYGQQFNSTTQRYGPGAGAYTSGRVGGQSFSNQAWDTGAFRTDSGRIGGQRFNCTTTRIGSLTTTNCN